MFSPEIPFKSFENCFNKHINCRTFSYSWNLSLDLSVGLFNVLVDIIWRFTVTWEAGNVACKVIKFLQCMTTYASTYVLVALSIDRYDAITHPMNFSNCCKYRFMAFNNQMKCERFPKIAS